ncbi:hypothetical protein AINA4_11780 [Aurantimicrobium sp. INA4]|nr:hypothetical protein AINA4_11780 [Aurantimicrobium sp. INA4]
MSQTQIKVGQAEKQNKIAPQLQATNIVETLTATHRLKGNQLAYFER